MQIRKAREEDYSRMLAVYERARQFMRDTGNPNQWKDTDPRPEAVLEGIRSGKAYVAVSEGKAVLEEEAVSDGMAASDGKEEEGCGRDDSGEEILGAFYFAIEEDASYQEIFEGKWKNQEAYGVIHRVASSGSGKGFAAACFDWCREQCLAFGCRNLRIDTHADNKVMQHVLEKNGFAYCGKIYLQDGAMRLAYQKCL